MRLTAQQLEQLPAGVDAPRYVRGEARAGIVHLGIGAFHRAHQAWYTEQVLNRYGGDWTIVGASLRSAGIRDRLTPQDGLYTLVERDGEQRRYQVIGAIKAVMVGPEDPQRLIDQLSHPDIRVVTLTITEKGYCYDAGGGGLRLDHADIRGDIERFPETPVTAIGYLASSLARRFERGLAGVTLLSCDNLPHNGRVLKTVVTEFVAAACPTLLPWIEAHVTFPCSMVDRIVPASTEMDVAGLEKILGYRDEAAVFTEPFSQWVIEDNFACGAPAWDEVGALFTGDVTPFETMKLRLLNGSHSLIAYLGYLAGHDYVHQVMADDSMNNLVRLYMDRQAQPSFNIPAGFDIGDYKNSLCQRFANAALNHRTAQIAQDGSQKIPQRWLATVRELSGRGESTSLLALAVAGWIRYLGGRRDNGECFTIDDPLAAELEQALGQGSGPGQVFGMASVFGDLLCRYPGFFNEVERYYKQLENQGVDSTVAQFLKKWI